MSVEEVSSRVQRILVDKFGTVRVAADGDFYFDNESAIGRVRVLDWGDGDTIVKIESPLLRDVDLTPAVFEWVATDGQYSWFAHAKVVRHDDNPRRGNILWDYDLLGNFLDADELPHCVGSVMAGANHLDDELQKRFGGRKGND